MSVEEHERLIEKDRELRVETPEPRQGKARPSDLPAWAKKMLADGTDPDEVAELVTEDQMRIQSTVEETLGRVADAGRKVQAAESKAFADAKGKFKSSGFSKGEFDKYLGSAGEDVLDSYHALRAKGMFKEAISTVWAHRMLSEGGRAVNHEHRNSASLPEGRRGVERSDERVPDESDRPKILPEDIENLRSGNKERVKAYMRKRRAGRNNALSLTSEPPDDWEGA